MWQNAPGGKNSDAASGVQNEEDKCSSQHKNAHGIPSASVSDSDLAVYNDTVKTGLCVHRRGSEQERDAQCFHGRRGRLYLPHLSDRNLRKGRGCFQPTEELKKLNADLGDSDRIDLGSGKWDAYAATLANYTHAPYLTEAVSAAVTDGSGLATFQNLKLGVYMVLGESRVVDGKKYTFSPNLISVPTSKDGIDWNYDVTAEAKYDAVTLPPAPQKHKYTVTKYWQNDDGKGRPASIDVTVSRRDLQSSGSFGDWHTDKTYTLSAANNWSETWAGADNAEYQVAENGTVKNEDGSQYVVSIRTSSKTDADGTESTWFSLTNRKTAVTPPDGAGKKPSGDKENSAGTSHGTSGVLGNVKTGDDSRMDLWLVLLIASGAVLVLRGVVGLRRK